MDIRRAIDADRDGDVVSLEEVAPFVIYKCRVSGYREVQHTVNALHSTAEARAERVEPVLREQQRFASMKNDR
jgi:hypothetical protein